MIRVKNRKDFYSILDFGAMNDGRTLCTTAFKKTVNTCSEAGGGIVFIPKGEFLSGSVCLAVSLQNAITIHFSAFTLSH
jgi:polygalacturonase